MLTLIIIIIAIGTATFAAMKLGFIKDADGNNIPDKVEEVVKEGKARAKRVKEEVDDVVDAVKEVGKQLKDIPAAAKGETRKGRKKSK